MTSTVSPAPLLHSRNVPAWVVFAVVVTAEYLGVSFAIDARDVLAPARLEAHLGRIGDVAPLAFLFPTAVFLVGGGAVRLKLRALSQYRQERGWMVAMGGLSAALFGAVVALGLFIRQGDFSEALLPRALVGVWFAAVLVMLPVLALSLWSPRMLLDALGGLRREFGLGFVVSSIAWGSGLLMREVWYPLAQLTLEFVHALLTVITPDPVASLPEVLVGTSRFYVEVAPECSGVEGIALMITFVGAYLIMQRPRLRWPRSLLLLPASALFVWLLNVVRMTALVLVGTWYSPEVALGGFHSKAGWVFFALCALGTVAFVQQSSLFQSQVEGPPEREAVSRAPSGALDSATRDSTTHGAEANATAAYLAPLLAILAAKLITGLLTSGFDYFYAASVLAAAVMLWHFRQRYPRVDLGSLGVGASIGGLVAGVWIFFFPGDVSAETFTSSLAALPGPVAVLWLVLRAVGTIVTVPIAEELAFRGYLLRRFVSDDFERVPYQRFSWLGLIVSSAAFGALHSQWILGTLAGVVFAGLAVSRGRLGEAIVAHAVANAVIFGFALMTGRHALIA